MALASQLINPELMVIGDSLAQGCRSLTVNAELCTQSWGARVAAAQRWKFLVPDFPRPILFDLDYEVRHLGELINVAPTGVMFGGFVTRFFDNLRAWLLNKKESNNVCFDNLGLTGAKISDLFERTAVSSDNEIKAEFPHGPSGPLHLPIHTVGNLHIAINGRFTLNPSQDPAYANFSPMEWVRQRRPARLFVQIGHNHGLYSIGGDAKNVPVNGDDQNGNTFRASFEELAKQLGGLPSEVKQIVVSLLPKVGAVANLRPQDNNRSDGYADSYEPVFSTSKKVLTRKQLSVIDLSIRDLNGELTALLRSAISKERLTIIDTYAFFNANDYKNTLDSKKRIAVDPDTQIDNFYIAGKLVPQFPPKIGVPPLVKKLARGGFQSIDGMHPSGCGYDLLALHVIKQLGLTIDQNTLKQAFLEDRLLHDCPLKLDLLVTVLMQLRRALLLESVPISETDILHEAQQDLHVSDALALMKQVLVR